MLNKLLNKDTQRMVIVAAVVSALVYILMDRFAPKVSLKSCNRSNYSARAMLRNIRRKKKSKYVLKPQAITTAGEAPEGGLNSLPYEAKCTPGMQEGAYYTKALTPGGFCGDQAYVNQAMHGYKIESGIGGPLLQQ